MTKALLIVFFPLCASAMTTVPYVDVGQYLGRWYQISRNILPFEGDCHCSQQTLSVNAAGNVGVYNSCNDGAITGKKREIFGEAFNDDPVTNARFTVDFGLPQKGQYWIIGLDSKYRYAVVSEPSGKSLYILSKTPELDSTLYQEAVAEAAKQVDTSKLAVTVHSGCTYP